MATLKSWITKQLNREILPEVWVAEPPLRGELLSLESLRQFASSLARERQVANGRGPNLLLPRLAANEKILRDYNEQTLEVEKTRQITPAAEWLLDNFHLIEEQIRTTQRHLPRRFNRQLPCLLNGPWADYPRVYEIALELIAHTDGRIDAAHLTSFVMGYQEVVPLKLGELWAIPIMLRLGLIENLRRVAVNLSLLRQDRNQAEDWAVRILQMAEANPSKLIVVVGEMAQAHPVLSRAFVTGFMRRLQEKTPPVKLAASWIEERVMEDGQTVDQLMQAESQSQAATQVSVGNSIGSLRFLDTMDWREFVEAQSVVEQALRTDPANIYADMDFATRDLYRHSVEHIARYSRKTESEVALLAVQLAQKNSSSGDDRLAHIGFFLTGKGARILERAATMRIPARCWLPRLARHFPLAFYLGGITVITLLAAIPPLWLAATASMPDWLLAILAFFTLLCTSQLAVSLVNWFATLFVKPSPLPRLDYSEGIPPTAATLVVVPTMLTSELGIENLLEALEVRYLSNHDQNIYFALLTDFCDAAVEHKPDDAELLQRASQGIEALNQKYKTDRLNIFFLFHRPRRWNPREKIWMGYERKRGKLADLNHCLRGGSRECFSRIVGDLAALPHIKYVITLDTDTQLPRDAARQMTATMAHPLNRPIYDLEKGLIVEGYTILQPRVAVSLPTAGRSRFVKLFSGDPGIDPYTRTVSDVYQDVFHEGSFIGKGIYDVDAFERTVGGKFPENRILSHDLLEGSYARSALISDVQLFEEFPSCYSAEARRRHRWMRGDWQIATWLLPRLPGPDVRRVENPLTGLSRWKIFDNLRRSLVPSALVFLLALGWILFPWVANEWSGFILAIIVLPAFLAVLTELWLKPKDLPWSLHLKSTGRNAGRQACQAILTVAFLANDAVISLDAVVRTLGRLLFTRRHLLEWQTASEVDRASDGRLYSFFNAMCGAQFLAGGLAAALMFLDRPISAVAFGFIALWLVSPIIAWWISLPLKEKSAELSAGQIRQLHTLARQTWNFFETFVNAEENWLPPDNFQEYPQPVIAARTSPTNIGLALLGSLSAYDFGYLTLGELMDRTARTLETTEKLERYRGHFYNWYDTRTLKPLLPLYVSTVDNGNLTGLLLTLHSGLLELADLEWNPHRIHNGLRATFDVMSGQSHGPELADWLAAQKKLLELAADSPIEMVRKLDRLIEENTKWPEAKNKSEIESWWQTFEKSCREQREEIIQQFPWLHLHEPLRPHLDHEAAHELRKLWFKLHASLSLRRLAEESEDWLEKLDELRADAQAARKNATLESILADLHSAFEVARERARIRIGELENLAQRCDEQARLDFTLLYDPVRELFSIGYNVSQHRLDTSCYDLLASEARLGSYAAIALGQVPQNHWFRLGRSLTPTGGKPTLISWSGSMFEYLMPMLVMPSYENTLLDYSCKSAVARQIQYGKQINLPWGMSESGYNLRDAAANYQYRAFGVPGLGYKRGLAHDVVIAPYATVMALMVAPEAACKNLAALRLEKAAGKYGLYEALDYTPSRVPSGQTHAVVRSFMVHHQGMSLLSLAYTLLDRPMQRRFNTNPLFKSAELLLHERVPRETAVLYPHELEAGKERETSVPEATLRVFTDPNVGPPEVHLLSNGRYHVMVTNSGGGYSRWNDTLMTRWREDATRDHWGTFFYLRDVEQGHIWSPTHQPTCEPKLGYEAIFSQGRAEFRSRLHEMDSHLEIAVSPENDVEVRRITFTNHSDETRTIEVTSYAEIVLNSAAADLAHPAFSNLFVQTQLLPAQHAVLCSRRPRAAHEKPPFIGHVLLLRGQEVGSTSFETDRSRFIGRGGSTAAPVALKQVQPLSNSEGSVLDPIAAIRRTFKLEPKESATVTLVSGIAPTHSELVALVEKYQDQSIADRCFELAWTHGAIVLRHLNTTEAEAQLYGRLAGPLLYNQAARRAGAATLLRNRRGQRDLWRYGISGDLPIVLLYSTRLDRIELVRQAVQAHAYWRLKGLTADLVILNEDDSVYRQALPDQILNIITANNATQLIDKPGGIFIRRAEQLPPEDKILLETVARIILHDDKGSLPEQLQSRLRTQPLPPPMRLRAGNGNEPAATLPPRDLIFFNGLGGFTRDGREYVITLKPGESTPAPWVNVIANPNFGTLVSESGGAYTWSENCHEFRLTPWNNDAVTDASGEAFYLRDETTGKYWSPMPLPARGAAPYVSRHGFGYSVFEHVENGIASEQWIYVAIKAPVKFVACKLKNNSDRRRRLSVIGYWEWVLGELRQKSAANIVTEIDPQTGALLARNFYNADFAGRTAFVTCSEFIQSSTADRTEFIGRNGSLAQPAALRRAKLSGRMGAGFDPCAAVQAVVELEPGQEHEIIFVLGAGKDMETARDLVRRFQSSGNCREELEQVWNFWNRTLGALHVETPEPALDVLANGWLPYQTISCRLWARTGFYQSGGAFGFRDQLQDSLALAHLQPQLLREQILRAAAHEFREGDVQHWWHPPLDRGVRTHFSDDYLWLPFAVCRYVETIGDTGVLDVEIPFLEGRAVKPEEESYYDQPRVSAESGTLYDHCVRAVKNGLRFGEHGLPLMGCGDWNDGMNLIGEKGRGESVWLAFFLYDVLKRFSRIAEKRGDQAFAEQCEREANTLAKNIEANAWDGQWYRRAYFDDGSPLGSASNPECQIDSLPQSWAVISGAGDQERARTALDAVAHRLVRREMKLIQLFDPPFDKSALEPGYIKGYVPGVRENGGQYTHAAVWAVMAFALAGETERAWDLFKLINPVLHGGTPADVTRYKVEPYVVAADVYSVAPQTGRGGWTWYTGSAGWMYRLILETFLGVELAVDELRFAPKIPAGWKSFKLNYHYRETTYRITCLNLSHGWKLPPKIFLDGNGQPSPTLKLVDDRREHFVEVKFDL
ncbi:MAG TPA: glucoamylase family protein [Verrucomicrobiae bacterium]